MWYRDRCRCRGRPVLTFRRHRHPSPPGGIPLTEEIVRFAAISMMAETTQRNRVRNRPYGRRPEALRPDAQPHGEPLYRKDYAIQAPVSSGQPEAALIVRTAPPRRTLSHHAG